MSKLSKNVIEKIHDKHIKPLPKWMFIAGHIVVWSLFTLSIVIGSIAISLGLYKLFILNDWNILGHLPGGNVGGFLLILPYIWILTMGLMIFIAFKLFEKTNKGYKVDPWITVIASVLISFILGSVLFVTKGAEGMENFMRKNIKPYQMFMEIREEIWHAPENGILPGRIVGVKGNVMIIMDDLRGKTWNVDISSAIIPSMMKIEVGQTVIAIGEIVGPNQFEAEGLRPAKILRERLMRPLIEGQKKK